MTLSPRFPPARAHPGYPTGTPPCPQSTGSPPDSLSGTPVLLPNQPAKPPAPKGCPIPALSAFSGAPPPRGPNPAGTPLPRYTPIPVGTLRADPRLSATYLPNRVAPHLEEVSPSRALWLPSAPRPTASRVPPRTPPRPKQTHLVRLILHSAQCEGLSAQRAHDAIQGLRAAQPLPAHQLAKVRLGGTEWVEVRGSPPFHPLSSLSNSIFVPQTLLLHNAEDTAVPETVQPCLPGAHRPEGETDPFPGG